MLKLVEALSLLACLASEQDGSIPSEKRVTLIRRNALSEHLQSRALVSISRLLLSGSRATSALRGLTERAKMRSLPLTMDWRKPKRWQWSMSKSLDDEILVIDSGQEQEDASSPRVMAHLQSSQPGFLFQEEILPKAPCLRRDYNFSDLELLEEFASNLDASLAHIQKQDLGDIRRGLEVAFLAHHGQRRKSGEPFIIHPVEVARILAEDQMDSQMVIAGLLHDTVEDTELSFDEIEVLFNKEVSNIVKGETEVSQMPDRARPDMATKIDPQNEQAENLRSLFVAMAADWRIIVVKLADRLHNMRTLTFMPRPKQVKKARETLEIYVPLAQRLGLWKYKTELSDLSFEYLYPDDNERINKYIDEHRRSFDVAIASIESNLNQIRDDLCGELKANWTIAVTNRTKDKYSIWAKMNSHNRTIGEIKDLVAVRVVITGDDPEKEKLCCYDLLSRLETSWTTLPNSFKDYIQSPKPNNYQSLHVVLLINEQPVEVQIRTHAMHNVAEYGAASHFSYKDASVSRAWLENIGEWQGKSKNASEFIKLVKANLNSKSVFVTLGNGTIWNFSRGATIRDVSERFGAGSMHVVLVNGGYQGLTKRLCDGDKISLMRIDIPRFEENFYNNLLGKITSSHFFPEFKEDQQWQRCRECLPLLGDDLIGTDEFGGLRSLHRKGCYCRKLEKLRNRFDVSAYDKGMQRFLKRQLEPTPTTSNISTFPSQFVVFGRDRPGLLADILRKIEDFQFSVTEMIPEVLEVDGDTTIQITVEVPDKISIEWLINGIDQVEGVTCCKRGSAAELSHSLSSQGFWRLCSTTHSEI